MIRYTYPYEELMTETSQELDDRYIDIHTMIWKLKTSQRFAILIQTKDRRLKTSRSSAVCIHTKDCSVLKKT